ncbi:MAG TPA: hypothetical protein VKE69_12395 [Planctomycetota bacterium]|nr:hypothetical protein [Planctomycetota bacterium]
MREARAPLLVFVLALAIRVVPLGHGLPGLYVPDSHGVRNALGMAQDRDLVPRANRYSSYPYLFSYACLPLFAADYALAKIEGRAPTMDAYREDAGRHLERFHLLGRWVAAVAGAAAAAFATCAARAFAGGRAGVFAGLLAAFGPLPLLLSVHERPWSMVLAFTSLAIAAGIAALREGSSWKPLVVCAAAAGAAGGSHQVGAAAALVVVAAAVLRPSRESLAAKLAGGAALAATFAAAFLVGNPYLVRYGPKGAVATDLTESTVVSVGGQGLAMRFDAKHTVEAVVAFFTMETVVPLLAAAGAVYALRQGGALRRGALLLLAFAAPIVALCLAYTGTHARYFAVALPAAWVLAGLVLARMEESGGIGRAAAIACVALPIALSARLVTLLVRDDSRNDAARWIAEHVPAGARIAIEPYGPPVAASAASLRAVAAVDPDLLTRRERIVLDRNEPGFDALPLERAFSDAGPDAYRTMSRAGKALYPGASDVRSVLAAARSEYLVRVDRFPSASRSDALAALAGELGEPIYDVGPRGAAEALLPFEPRTGALALFAVDRPGPRVRVYRLSR